MSDGYSEPTRRARVRVGGDVHDLDLGVARRAAAAARPPCTLSRRPPRLDTPWRIPYIDRCIDGVRLAVRRPGRRDAARARSRVTVSAGRQRALLARRGRRPPGAAGRCALPADRRQPHGPASSRTVPRGDDPDPPAPRLPPPGRGRHRARRSPARSPSATRSAAASTSTSTVDGRTADDGAPLWTSDVTFTRGHARAGMTRAAPHDDHAELTPRRTRAAATTTPTPETASRLGLARLVAQGMQVAGPAYGRCSTRGARTSSRTASSSCASSAWCSADDTIETRSRRRRRRRDASRSTT